jgi:hypothetical protein
MRAKLKCLSLASCLALAGFVAACDTGDNSTPPPNTVAPGTVQFTACATDVPGTGADGTGHGVETCFFQQSNGGGTESDGNVTITWSPLVEGGSNYQPVGMQPGSRFHP